MRTPELERSVLIKYIKLILKGEGKLGTINVGCSQSKLLLYDFILHISKYIRHIIYITDI